MIIACHEPAAITAERDASAPAIADAPHAPPAPSDAGIEAGAPDADETDACVPGEMWEAHVRVRKTLHDPGGMLQGPLELVVPRLGARKTIYFDCGATGGGCGDCTRPSPGSITCELTPTHVRVDIGVDDQGPTFVDVEQRGNAVVAFWTYGRMPYDPGDTEPPTHETKTLVKLPCAVKIRFTRA